MAASVTGFSVDSLFVPFDIGPDPTFSWRMESDRPGAAQTAYRIVVSASASASPRPLRQDATENGGGAGAEPPSFAAPSAPVWDSGVVESPVSAGIVYKGAPLAPATRYSWTVEVRDEKGEWLPAAGSEFSTGFFDPACWDGSIWISAADSPVRSDASGVHDGGYKQEAEDGTAYFAKSVPNGKAVAEAWWCVAGLGVFEAYVNGKRVGNDFLKPGFTHFAKTKYSFCYDVTPLVRKGAAEANDLSAYVSAGWWRDKIVNFAGKRSAFRAVLILRHADGTETRVGTDATWGAAGAAGPVLRAAIFDGEDYDARIPAPWSANAGFAAAAPSAAPGGAGAEPPSLSPAIENTEFSGDLLPMVGQRIGLREDIALSPVSAYVWQGIDGADAGHHGTIRKISDGFATIAPGETLVVDFGQNCAAVPEFVFSAARGVTLSAHPAEMLNDGNGAKARGCDGPEGSVYVENYRLARTRANYTFAGTGEETYRPSFTFFGGRYLSITADGPVAISSIRWIPVSSVRAEYETASLETGDADVNRLVANILWGQRSNYLSVPTDCPQRNERLGWTADTQVFTKAASYNADVRGFLHKWLRDMRDSRLPDGGYPGVAPTAQYGANNHQFGWGDAGVIVPWTLWRHFGDRKVVEENWIAMARYLALLEEMKFDSDEARGHQWADWLSCEKLESCSGAAYEDGPDGKKRVRADAILYWRYLGCCYWLMDARMMAEMADGIGRAPEAAAYRAMAGRARDYIRAEFVDPADGMLLPLFRDMQTPALFALNLGLLDEAPAAATRDALLANIHEHGDKLQTGFLGTSILMDTLSTCCASPETAYTLLLQHAFPSWLYSVDQGATTVWERWNSYTKADGFGPVGMNSFNHYAYGAVFAWMMGAMAGIREDPAEPGFRRFVLAPLPDPRIGHVSARYRSPYGEIGSAWRYEGGKWIWRFTVPANTVATVRLPGEEPREFHSGSHEIVRP